ncbi:ankyrin [Dissoconium aciculare CBS 342.82]|uniref:Ankyrin n=1 Tax=Dissoconium aciculare CBS 342.82 TaxID=1314786 RepID=A0A6J3LUV8_9PEZI|nr:ankyrin [Dissoconium aciculare CBS 342.82]KAF1819453.1 ankyrin [Dissoconium aciculare CBS 342.82]
MFRIFVDPSIRPHDTALVKAIKSRDIGLVERLAGVAGLKGLVDENGNSALHVAAHLGLRYEAECLMINGANIEAENKLGHTPLVQAIRAKQLTLVNLLLEYGANKNAVNHGGRTTLQGACQMQCTDIIVALLAFTDSVQLEEFVNRRADNGRTALSFMSPTGAIEIIKLLLDAGASPEIEDQNGNSSLSWAAFWGQTETVKLFLDSGASKNPPSRISKWKKNGFQTSVSEKTRVEILALLETPESSRFKWKWGRSK